MKIPDHNKNHTSNNIQDQYEGSHCLEGISTYQPEKTLRISVRGKKVEIFFLLQFMRTKEYHSTFNRYIDSNIATSFAGKFFLFSVVLFHKYKVHLASQGQVNSVH